MKIIWIHCLTLPKIWFGPANNLRSPLFTQFQAPNFLHSAAMPSSNWAYRLQGAKRLLEGRTLWKNDERCVWIPGVSWNDGCSPLSENPGKPSNTCNYGPTCLGWWLNKPPTSTHPNRLEIKGFHFRLMLRRQTDSPVSTIPMYESSTHKWLAKEQNLERVCPSQSLKDIDWISGFKHC